MNPENCVFVEEPDSPSDLESICSDSDFDYSFVEMVTLLVTGAPYKWKWQNKNHKGKLQN